MERQTDSAVEFVTLTKADLDRLLAEAAARGAEQALAVHGAAWLDNAQAAQFIYGRDDRVEAFRALRYRYPEIDSVSTGRHRMRRWRRADLAELLSLNPKLRPRAQAGEMTAQTGGSP